MALPAPTKLTRRYLLDFTWRAAVFLMIFGIYLYDKNLLHFETQSKLFWPLSLLWVAVLVSMLAQLSPKSRLTTGCMKQYVTGYRPAPNYDREGLKTAVKQQNVGAAKVAALWLAVHGVIGYLYMKKAVTVAELVLLCAFYYLCDLICVLFFCPFQTFLMKNRCCVNCRIFAWGSWMMAVPLVFVPHLYARSLGADNGQETFCRMLDRMEQMLGGERASRFHSHFSKIQFTPGGGEKCHRTFADNGGYGPDWAPLAAEVARRGWSPTFICESAGTQAEDALEMKRVYQSFCEGGCL